MIASEAVPFCKTGGLADVTGALPPLLAARGAEVSVVLPFYRETREKGLPWERTGLRVLVVLADRHVAADVLRLERDGVTWYFLERPELFDRDGLYGEGGRDYWDNAVRYVVLTRGALELLAALHRVPDVLHLHDWQAALGAVYVKCVEPYASHFARTKTLLTIHNVAYQGVFWHWDMRLAGLPWTLFNPGQLEFWGQMNFLKGGIVFADAISTVSPTYAKEIRTPEHGWGLDGVLRDHAKRLTGVMNGIDETVWDPASDELIAARYSAGALGGKRRCKEALRSRLGLARDRRAPLAGVVSRLAEQKGVDLLVGALPRILDAGMQVAILGTGDPGYERALSDLAERYPGRLSLTLGFDDALAHAIEAGSDVYLMPSRFEPCGLNQLYSLRYGAVPIARATGGLADSVKDCGRDGRTGNGFTFAAYGADAFADCVLRAIALYRRPAVWKSLVARGMRQDWSWEKSADAYEKLYRSLVAPPGGKTRKAARPAVRKDHG